MLKCFGEIVADELLCSHITNVLIWGVGSRALRAWVAGTRKCEFFIPLRSRSLLLPIVCNKISLVRNSPNMILQILELKRRTFQVLFTSHLGMPGSKAKEEVQS